MSIIFRELSLTNWIPYVGNQTIGFSYSDKSMNITLIRGQNKGGKSAIIRAIKWALYGDTGDISEYRKPLDLLNRDAKNQGDFQFSVCFLLEKDGKRIEITRTVKPSEGISKPNNSDFDETFSIKEDSTYIYGDALHTYVKEMLSKDFSDFFLFDGEMLQKYKGLSADTAQSRDLRKQIEKVIKTPYLKTACTDLLHLRRDLIKKLGDGTDDKQVQVLLKGLEKLAIKEQEYEDMSKALNDSLALEIEKLKKVESNLMNHTEMMETYQQIEELKNKSALAKNEIENTKDILKSQGATAWTSLASDFIESKRAELEEEEKELSNFVMDSRTRDVLHKLYQESDSHCKLCEGALTAEQQKSLKNKINTHYSEDTIAAEDRLGDIRKLLNKITTSDHLSTLRRQPKKFHDHTEKLYGYEIEIENLKRQSSSSRQEDLSRLIEQRTESEHEIKKLEESIARCENELNGPSAQGEHGLYGPEGIRKDKEQRETLLKDIQKDKPIKDKNQQMLDLCISADKVLNSTLDKLVHEVRKEIEGYANEMYKKMTVEKSSTSLQINESFGLDVIDANGEIITTSSAGNQIVALSLLYGLKKATGLKGPLLIDTPFARIDLEHRASMLNSYVEMPEQIILLVHSGEIKEGDDLELSIAKSIGARYKIQKESDTNSRLVKV